MLETQWASLDPTEFISVVTTWTRLDVTNSSVFKRHSTQYKLNVYRLGREFIVEDENEVKCGRHTGGYMGLSIQSTVLMLC